MKAGAVSACQEALGRLPRVILVPHREDRWGIYGHKGRIFRRAGYWSGSVSGVGVEIITRGERGAA